MFDGGVGVDGLDRRGVLAFLGVRHRDLLAAEADRLVALGHWADLHGCEECDGGEALAGLVPGRPAVPGAERGRVFGGDGNPQVLEFCVAEVAAILGTSTGAVVAELADVQDLRFRHPLLWGRVKALQVRGFRAREIVRRTRHLSAEAARWVDTQTVQAATSLSWRSFLDRLDAKVAAADTALAAQRARAEQTSRFVRTSRTDGFGMRMLVAKLAAKDAAWIEAMVTELARKLAALGDPDPAEARRANAFALLGHPLKVLQVLAAYDAAVADGRIQPVPATEAEGVFEAAAEPPVPVDPLDPHAPAEPVDPDEQAAEAVRAGNPILTGLPDPHAWLGWLAGLDWKRMLPQVLLYLHASHEAVASGEGVARLEDADGPLGPVLLTQLAALFGPDTPVTVKPVLDLADVAPQDAYEARGRLREAVRLVHPHDAFPHAASTSPKLDLDHPIPYRPVRAGGPPGQTHLGNQAPLSRFHHRIKTHSAWQLRQPETGVYLWRSPHGYYFQTDQDGTHRLTAQAGQAYWNSTTPFGTRLTITYAELLADLKDTG